MSYEHFLEQIFYGQCCKSLWNSAQMQHCSVYFAKTVRGNVMISQKIYNIMCDMGDPPPKNPLSDKHLPDYL